MKKNPNYPQEIENPDGMNVVLNLAGLNPSLDGDNNLIIQMPWIAGPIFASELVQSMEDALGGKEADTLLDKAAHVIHVGMVSHVLAAKMR